ncbi:MAG: ATP synthase F1 subunit epsilon [Atopococcus tabaci]|uniref:ATP synthase epsilon chain n=1 Tax=Atopococcus tabaci TaxID=269774 RepID=A0AA43UC33_9LACT|nr:ATP synthase F1 subunit epsilon [Atopococcus tabaci]
MTNQTYLEVNVYAPNGLIFSNQASFVTADTPSGEIGILPHHISLVTPIDTGAVKVTLNKKNQEDKEAYIAVNGGIMEVHNNTVNIVASFAIRARDIDEADVRLEMQKAESEMETALMKKDTAAYTRARIELKHAINQIDVKTAKLKNQK